MSDIEQLKAENTDLRQQIEAFRVSELDGLIRRLADAEASVVHYRSEAERNANLGRQIHAEAQAELNRLRDRVRTLEQLPNARVPRPSA